MKTSRVFLLSVAISFLVVFTAGCSNILQQYVTKDLVPISSIGIMPAQPARTPVKPSDTKTLEQLEAGAQTLDSLLQDYFKDYENVGFISQTTLQGLQSSQSGRTLHIAQEAGTQLHFDAVLVTEVHRYQARTGSTYAVITPASVAFSFTLLAVASGQVIWSADFDQTQKTLFENILSTRATGSGFRWLTAEELAQAGLTKKLNGCPYLKKN